jgi:DNA-binding transcriptional LysR family regulator
MNRPVDSALNHLRVRHLKLVETLVRMGSVHKAAKTLHLSQPAASAMLHETEDALGTVLFDRTRKGVVLNKHGIAALARLRVVLGELDMLAEEFQSPQIIPVMRVGSLQHAFFGVLQSFLPRFLSRTNCRVDLITGSVTDLVARLQRSELDCLIGSMPAAAWTESSRNWAFFYRPLYENQICVVAGATHPLARKRRVTLEDLSRFTWILSRPGSNTRYVLMSAFAAAGLPPPQVRIETESFVFSFPLLAVSDYLAVVPRDAALNQQRLGVARILAINLPQLLTPVAFIAQRSSMMNPNVALLWRSIREAMRLDDQPVVDGDFIASRSITILPPASKAARAPGGTTQVASYSSTMSGPVRARTRSERRITGVSSQEPK